MKISLLYFLVITTCLYSTVRYVKGNSFTYNNPYLANSSTVLKNIFQQFSNNKRKSHFGICYNNSANYTLLFVTIYCSHSVKSCGSVNIGIYEKHLRQRMVLRSSKVISMTGLHKLQIVYSEGNKTNPIIFSYVSWYSSDSPTYNISVNVTMLPANSSENCSPTSLTVYLPVKSLDGKVKPMCVECIHKYGELYSSILMVDDDLANRLICGGDTFKLIIIVIVVVSIAVMFAISVMIFVIKRILTSGKVENAHPNETFPLLETEVEKFFQLKIKNADKELIEFIKQNLNLDCKSIKSILHFSQSYEIIFTEFEQEDYQITVISEMPKTQSTDNNCPVKISREKERLYDILLEEKDVVIYESEDHLKLCLMQKMPHQRLIDSLQEFHVLEQIEDLIIRVYDTILTVDNNIKKVGFRADNIYIDKELRVYFNYFIPNVHVPFINASLSLQPSWHLHEKFIELSRNDGFSYRELLDWQCLAQFIFSFGCFVWILIEGTGKNSPDSSKCNPDQWLTSLREKGKFRNYPNYLDDIMSMCWAVQWNSDSGTVVEKIRRIFEVNRRPTKTGASSIPKK